MQRRHIKQATTLEERLSDHARRAREDVEKLPPGKERDALVQKLREIEAAVHFNHLLLVPSHNRDQGRLG